MEFRQRPTVRRRVARTAAFASVAALAIVLAGCSSWGQQAAASGGAAAPKAPSSIAPQHPFGPAAVPGAFGLIAEIDGSTLQVQSQSEQTAVSFNSKTAIEEITPTSVKSLTPGWCATVISSTKAASPGSTPSKITATSVALTRPTHSSCTIGGGRFNRGDNPRRPSGAPTDLSGGGKFPTGGASGRFPHGRSTNTGSFAFGKITKVSGSGFVLAAQSRTPRPTSAAAARSVSVAISGSTTLTAQETVTSAAIKRGECVRARGKTDDTGAVTATNLILSSAVKGQCVASGGFGGFSGRRGGSGSHG